MRGRSSSSSSSHAWRWRRSPLGGRRHYAEAPLKPIRIGGVFVPRLGAHGGPLLPRYAGAFEVLLPLPVDLGAVTMVAPPGQRRGGNYKGHGYYRFAVGTNAQRVVMPVKATIVAGSQYIEGGEVQYLLYAYARCGIWFAFDHLHDLSPKVAALFAKLPAPKPDDSRTLAPRPLTLPAGALVATRVGFVGTGNASLDFGAYDALHVSPGREAARVRRSMAERPRRAWAVLADDVRLRYRRDTEVQARAGIS